MAAWWFLNEINVQFSMNYGFKYITWCFLLLSGDVGGQKYGGSNMVVSVLVVIGRISGEGNAWEPFLRGGGEPSGMLKIYQYRRFSCELHHDISLGRFW